MADRGDGRITWFLMGAALGAACAILYAPKSGKETRNLISQKAQDASDAVSDTSRDLLDRSKDVLDKGKQVVDDAAALFDRGRKLVPAADLRMSRLALGNFEIHVLREAVYHWDGGALFGVVPKTLWSRTTAADEQNRIPLAFNCYLIRTDEHQLLIETGGGDKQDARARERMKLPAVARPLPEVIAEAGHDPEQIDLVINSHLHWDHCGGNTILHAGTARPAFPRAAYYAPRGEWEHAHLRLARDSISYIDANYDPLVESGRMKLIEPGAEIAPGIHMHAAPGHNRDMMVITASSGGSTFCFLSDLVPTAAHLAPTWVAAFDLYPLETIENKIKWLGKASAEGWFCGFGHDTEIDFARIAAVKKSFRALV